MISKECIVQDFSELVTLPSVYLKVKNILQDSEYSIEDLANVIILDPAISSRLLKIVNSAFFGRQGHINTVSRAVNVLGSNAVHDIVLAASVSRAFNYLSQGIMDMRVYWLKSIGSAMVARELAKRSSITDHEPLFIQGLLRDIGHLVIFQKCPAEAEEIYINHALSNPDNWTVNPIYELERKILGFDFAEIGSELLKFWQFPGSISTPISEQLEPVKDNEALLESLILHVTWAMIELNDIDKVQACISEFVWDALEMEQPGKVLKEIQNIVDQESADVFDLFFANIKSAA